MCGNRKTTLGVRWWGGWEESLQREAPGETREASESPLQERETGKVVGRGGVGCTQAGGRERRGLVYAARLEEMGNHG